MKIAILVGINSYSSRYETLRCSVNDVHEMGAMLEMKEYGYRVRKLLDEQATKTAILRELIEARSSGAETVIFYFSGHGVSTDFGTYLVTFDNAEFDEGIELAKLIEMLASGSDARQSLAILDCCHSGAAAVIRPSPYTVQPMADQDVQTSLRSGVQSVAVMAACMSSQQAWEETSSGHGIFTHYLLEGMLCDAVDHEGNLTANTIFEFVSRNMVNHGAYGESRQKPVFGGHLAGRLVLASGLTPALPPPLPEDEFRRIEDEAAEYIERYNSFKSQFDTARWRSEGHDACSRRLEAIDKWFTKQQMTPGLASRPRFSKAMETLMRWRIELGHMEQGTVLAEGILEERIGEGGFGTVWKVRNPDTGHRVALKLYHPHEMHDREKSRRFETGYDAMKMLRHPQIVSVHRYSRCPTGFVMEFIDGQNLRSLGIHSFMDPAPLVRVLIEIAEAISHAHDHDVIHRDIKPENIVCELLPDGTWRPFLTDFDLAWFSTKTQRVTKAAMGAIYYAAPEQFIEFDPKAALTKTPALDVFSFGQLAFFCLTGRDPEPGRMDANAEALKEAAFRKGFDNASALALGDLYRRATVRDYRARPQSFSGILRDLRAIEGSLLHTSSDVYLREDEFIAELISSLRRIPVAPGDQKSYVTSAGTWEIDFSIHEKRKGRSYCPMLKAHFVPRTRLGLENVSNEHMRRTLNKRLDDALKPFESANRKSGLRGYFEVYVEVILDDLKRANVGNCADVISVAVAALNV